MDKRELQILITAKDKASKQLNKVGGIIQKNAKTFRNIGIGMTAVGAGITAGMTLSINEAKKAEGSYNKFNTVFGKHKDDMLVFIKGLRKTMPTATHEIVRMSADLQDLLVPLGLSREKATDMSKGFLDVSNKIAAFNDVDPTQVLEAIKSGLAGSSEPLRRFGVNALETALQSRALSMGLMEADQKFAELEPSVKNQIRAQALLAQIIDNSSDAIEGFEANNDSFIRRQQDLNATLRETKVTIGKALLPVVDELLKKIKPIIKKVSEWMKNNKELTKKIVIVVAAIGGLMVVLGPLLIMLPGIVTVVGMMGTAIAALTGPIGIAIAAIVALIAIGVLLYKNWDKIKEVLLSVWNKIKDTFTFAVAFIKGIVISLLDWLVPSWREDLDAIRGYMMSFWDKIKEIWQGISDTIGKAWDDVQEKVLSVWNKIKGPFEKIGGVTSWIGEKVGGGISGWAKGIAEKGGWAGAEGGIVRKPTFSLIGEAGPEAVIPLRKLAGAGIGGITVNINGGYYLSEGIAEDMGNIIIDKLKKQLKF